MTIAMTPSKILNLLASVGRFFLGGFAGGALGLALAAILGFSLGLAIGGVIALSETVNPPPAPPEGMHQQGVLTLALMLGFFSVPFGVVVGALAGSATLATARFKVGLVVSAVVGIFPSLVVCLDPNWYGGLELGSFPGCLVPGSVLGGITAATGIIIAAFASRWLSEYRSWSRGRLAVQG